MENTLLLTYLVYAIFIHDSVTKFGVEFYSTFFSSFYILD